MTKIELKLVSYIDMYAFVEKGMGGSISNIAKRFSKANNKYIKCYDNSKPNTLIMYLDANNLCGYTMSQYLPCSKFKQLSPKEI